MIILDFGSGNSCKNDLSIVKRMINELSRIDKDRKCIIKWQLFKECGENIPLSHEIFSHAWRDALWRGFETTASVFDIDSLNFLLGFNPKFVKIANRRDLDWLIGEIPRKIEVIISHASYVPPNHWPKRDKFLCCISKYPATVEDYESNFEDFNLRNGISDHTTDWTLYRKYQPEIYEVHYKLEDTTGPDGGAFARTPTKLEEIL